MKKAIAGVLVPLLVLVGSLLPARAQEGPPHVPDELKAFSIVPPGQEGDVTAAELAAESFGVNYDDQLELDASLVTDDEITTNELGNYFHTMQFGPGDDIATTTEGEGYTIYRDSLGIPHIYADDTPAASFALGFVTAEDRLWEADVFRHAARGTLAEFVGPSFLEMDIATRRDGYTEEEVQAMLDSFDDKFGEIGLAVQEGLQAYADGFNAYIETLPTKPQECPSEYQALNNPCPAPFPQEWTPTDTLFLAILQLRIFGETAGGELTNAGLFAHLVEKHGQKLGSKIYDDLLRVNDPRSPTSIAKADGTFPSQNLGKIKMNSVAIPDAAPALARRVAKRDAKVAASIADLGLTTPASNALLVSAKKSQTGNPLEWGAPQVGYAVPSFFMDVDVHTPDAHFRGPAVPGASALIPLGRGADYAWSLTTGYSDAVDTRAELLCDPEGGEAAEDSTGYMFDGECKPMESRDEMFLVKPNANDPGPPAAETRTFDRTVHGPVFARGMVDGKPVAFVKERFFWMRELDSIPQFYRWNTKVKNIDDFRAAAEDFTMSFNSFYADHDQIGYFHVGYYPKRVKGQHTSLPTWGTGEWEWKGRVPFSTHPKTINPKQGWVANWNNKPALGWDNYDSPKWGPNNRVELLNQGMRSLFRKGGKATLGEVVDVAREAATRDTRGAFLGKKMVRYARTMKGAAAEAVPIVKRWVKAGAHRFNRDGDDVMDDSPALVIFDAWYESMVHGIFDDELGTEGYDLIAAPISDYAPEQGSSFWFDMGDYVANLFNKRAKKAYARNYCDDLTTANKSESCKSVVRSALEKALKVLVPENGDDMSAWETPAENIVFQALGAGSVAPIPWQNRGTHNHAVEVLRKAR